MLTNVKIQASFPVRRMDYQFGTMPKYWFDNEPSLTHLLTSISTLFPEGESYFARSMRAVRGLVKNNTQLDRDISAFIGQEAMHSKEHHAFHVGAQIHGLDPESLEKMAGFIFKNIERVFSKRMNLLLTTGIEHYTSVFAEDIMNNLNEFMTDESIRNLWLWHSMEETEHKAVAFDLYEHIYGKGISAYVPRVAMFTFSFVSITTMMMIGQTILMKRDKQMLNLKSWSRSLKFMYQQNKRLMPKFLDYYRPSYHPNDHEDQELVTRTKIKIGLQKAS